MLFIIYINDYCKCPDVFNFIHFSDDSKIYVIGENLNKLTRTVKLSLNICMTSYKIFLNNKANSSIETKNEVQK